MVSLRPDNPRWEPTLRGTDGSALRAPRRKGRHPPIHPSSDDYYTKSICLSGAMAAGTASRYKTGPRLAKHS